MGGKPTKIKSMCRKVMRNQLHGARQHMYGYNLIDQGHTDVSVTKHELTTQECTGEHIEMECDENNNPLSVNGEIRAMQREFNRQLEVVRHSLNQLEIDHNTRLQICSANMAKSIVRPSEIPTIKGDPELEECRLRNSLLLEKLRQSGEYLLGYDSVIRSNEKHDYGQGPLVRKLLLKTTRRQLKKSRLNEAVETLTQLVVATKGQLCADEAWALFDVCESKVNQTLEFYQRLSGAVQTFDNNNSSYIFDDLWTSVVEDLRAECSELFDLTIKIKVEVAAPLEESCLVEKLKHLIASKVCALWLEITPPNHEEFDDVKDLFFDSLNKCIDAFLTLRYSDEDNDKATKVLNQTIHEFHRIYPNIAGSKRLKKTMDKIVTANKELARLSESNPQTR